MEVFVVNSGELRRRLDPIFYFQDVFHFLNKTKFDIRTVGDVAFYLKAGFAAGKQNQELVNEDGIIQIRPTNIDEEGNLFFDKNIFLPKDYIETKRNFLLSKEEVLFNNTNSQELVGKSTLFDIEGLYFCSNHITRIGVNQDLVSPFFLTMLLNLYQRLKLFYSICTNWNNQSGVNVDLLKSVKIPLPPLTTQNEIVSIMQNAYEQKKQKEAEASELLKSVDSYVMEALGIKLPEMKKEKCFVVESNELEKNRVDAYYHQPYLIKRYKAIHESEFPIVDFSNVILDLKNGVEIRTYTDSGSRYLRVTDLSETGINNDSPRFVEVDEIPERVRLSKSDFLISRSGSLGLVSVVTDEVVNSILSSHIFKVSLDTTKILPEYLQAYFRCSVGQFQFFHKNNGGIVPEINQDALKSLSVVLPPLNTQTEIAEEVKRRTEKAEALKREAVSVLEDAKKEVEGMILG